MGDGHVASTLRYTKCGEEEYVWEAEESKEEIAVLVALTSVSLGASFNPTYFVA